MPQGQQMAECNGGHGGPQRVLCLAVQCQALLEKRLGPGLVCADEEGEAGSAERQGALLRRHLVAAGQDPFRVAGQLFGMAVQPPEPPRRPDQVQRRGQLISFGQPGQRLAEVAVPDFQPVQPGQLPGPLQFVLGGLARARK